MMYVIIQSLKGRRTFIKKELIIIGECILLVAMLVVIKIILTNLVTDLANNNVFNYALYFVASLGGAILYRQNMKNGKE